MTPTPPSGNMRNVRDSVLHFFADNIQTKVHPVRRTKGRPDFDALQVSALNITFHDSTYSVSGPSHQFLTLDILHDDELSALDIEEDVVKLLQLGGATPLLDYSQKPPEAVSNSLIYWNPQNIKFRTVAATSYFHRSAVMEVSIRYV